MLEHVLVGLIGLVALLMALRALAPAAWLAARAESVARRLDGGALRGPARLLRAWAPSPDAGCGGCGGGCTPATGEVAATPGSAGVGAAVDARGADADEASARPVRVLRRTSGHVLREVPLRSSDGPGRSGA